MSIERTSATVHFNKIHSSYERLEEAYDLAEAIIKRAELNGESTVDVDPLFSWHEVLETSINWTDTENQIYQDEEFARVVYEIIYFLWGKGRESVAPESFAPYINEANELDDFDISTWVLMSPLDRTKILWRLNTNPGSLPPEARVRYLACIARMGEEDPSEEVVKKFRAIAQANHLAQS